jgi:hypothetical protein
MSTVTTGDRTQIFYIFYKDWGQGSRWCSATAGR